MRLRPVVTLLIASVALGAGCGSEDRTIDDAGLPYSFSYPEGFARGEEAPESRGGGFANRTVIAKGQGGDLVSVQTQSLRRRVTRRLLPRVKRELAISVRGAGRIKSREDLTVAGIPGVRFRVDLRERGTAAAASWVYLPRGRVLYWINCQWQRDQRAVLDACGEVLRTFRIR